MQTKTLLRGELRRNPRKVWEGFEERIREDLRRDASVPLPAVMRKWEESLRFGGGPDGSMHVANTCHATVQGYVEMRRAHDAMVESARAELDLALAMTALHLGAVEQYTYDRFRWDLAYHLTLLDAPPVETGWRRSRPVEHDPEGCAPSVDPRWASALLSYLGEVDLMQRRRLNLRTSGTPPPPPLNPAAPDTGVMNPERKKKMWLPRKEWLALLAERKKKEQA